MQTDNTAHMIVPVYETMQLLSEAVTLETGDVVVMGAPAGAGCGRELPVRMRAGATIGIGIGIEIEDIGTRPDTRVNGAVT